MADPKVLIVDDHATFGQSLGELLSQHQIAEAFVVTSVPAALAFLGQQMPDVLLLDITLHTRFEGLDFLSKLTKKWPSLKVACLTMHNSQVICEKAYSLGAWAFFTKIMPLSATLEGIQALLNSDELLPEPKFKEAPQRFTPREKQILAHLAKGASNKEIAKKLSMAEETAKVHMKALLRKLDVQNRTQVAIYAYENGF